MTRSVLTLPTKVLLVLGLMILGFTSCDKFPPINEGGGKKTIYQTIASDSRFKLLTVAVAKAGLIQTLNDKEASLTLFAPTDDAFRRAGFKDAGDIAAVPEESLKAILLYHVLGSEVKSHQIPLAANSEVNTVANKPIFATRTSAGKVFINGVSVIQKDIDAKNGVVHAIDRVLLAAVGNIVATAQGNPNLSLLVAAVLRASQGDVNVAAVLSGTGPFTVFAPTNQAFINAGFANAAAFNSVDPNVLTPILTYHVIGARVFSSDLVNNSTPTTVNGGTVKITLTGGPKVLGKTNIKPSNIVITDILTTNGVVHVIDQVLLP